ncbi:LysR family transcriptional regulator [Salipiger mangrovisoli]|uniref:LysR family transcriptional regulator n=1 Tax=Salipiger mangrovisoli TaxID=2865933 RepID=A0ABR9X9G0_9RHOB|nr:LysR family transcriptional regulator [Salipiger mangrovisoli]MBE9640213.1 LysR family transcriptional regulator [Salipiger mangrovisoli]
MRHLVTLLMIRDVARAGSIRRAAEDMNITSSALNRRIQSFEEEFGAPIFERLPRGVRLNPAGELLMQHIQAQVGDLARIRSLIADLSGERRGHVSIACSQALNPVFLPREVARYRAEHPGVTFSIRIRDRAQAEHELSTFATDLALVFEPVHLVDFEVIQATEQPVCAVLSETHPLAGREELRLRDCLAERHIIPSPEYGVRHLLEQATHGRSLSLRPVVEADSFELMRQYALYEQIIGFQIPIGIPAVSGSGLVVRPIHRDDIEPGLLLLGQMRGRTLPVASAKFAQQIARALQADPVP